MGMIETLRIGLQDTVGIPFIRFGDGGNHSIPYGVLKPEKMSFGRGLRIIIHDVQGNQDAIETDLRNAVVYMQNRKLDYDGKSNIIGEMIDYTDVTAVSDDDTISMEALFMVPTHFF